MQNSHQNRDSGSLKRPVFIIAVVTLAFSIPMFFNPSGIRSEDSYRNADWLSILFFSENLIKSVREFGQFPLWSPYVGGGYPTIQHHSDGSMTPFAIPVLLLGEIYGTKINLLLLLFIGGLGIFFIARDHLRIGETGSLFSALAYVTSGWFPSMMLVGFYNLAMFHLIPFIVYFFVKAFTRFRFVIAAGLLYAIFSFVGGSGFYTVGIFLGLIALAYSFRISQRKLRFSFRPLTVLSICFLITLTVGAVKFIGIQDLIQRGFYPNRDTICSKAYPGKGAPGDTFYTGIRHFFYSALNHVPKKVHYVTKGVPMTDEYSYLGIPWLAFFMFFFSACFLRKRALPWLFSGLVVLVLCFGPYSPIDFYKILLWPFKRLCWINHFYKYTNFFILLTITLLSGATLDTGKLRGKLTVSKRWLIGIVFATLMPFAINNALLFSELFKLNLPKLNRSDTFFQVSTSYNPIPSWGKFGYRGIGRPIALTEYYNSKQNIGTTDWHADIFLPEMAIPKFFVHPESGAYIQNPSYKGEAFFVDDANQVESYKIKSNTIDIQVNVNQPGLLVINQNYHPDWHTNKNQLKSYNNLLAVFLNESGHYTVQLHFIPKKFYMGLLISLTSLALCLFYWFRLGNRPVQNNLKP